MIRTYEKSVCFITGGASGIGEALGRELARRGAHVVLADRQEDLAASIATDIISLGGSAEAVELDVRDEQAFDAAVDRVVGERGRLDYLFNNAGIGIGGPFEDQTTDDWRYIVDVNLMGVVYGSLAAYRHMRAQGFGHIVNTASMAGQIATPGLSSYGATKHAVVGLSRSLRIEGLEHGVRVSAFCPGVIKTAILDRGGRFGRMRGSAEVFEAEERPNDRSMDVNRFATLALDQVAANREIIVLPWPWSIMRWIDRISERLSFRLGSYMYRRMRTEMKERSEKS